MSRVGGLRQVEQDLGALVAEGDTEGEQQDEVAERGTVLVVQVQGEDEAAGQGRDEHEPSGGLVPDGLGARPHQNTAGAVP
ncbi:hypothetical protein [Streptomyces sp. VRA16 Mangrove soil]|uniref:hypothetical protein n=1 Tax=Streptomyces sp. VRA16 Mangrove soil TaxID=2817434 RepID=UPI001A9E02B6|nr:hypothetical protein [Streptomyces sp. VRA16 Mangrove soil]